MSRDSAGAKIAVVLGIGAIALGTLAFRGKVFGARRSEPTAPSGAGHAAVSAVAVSAPVAAVAPVAAEDVTARGVAAAAPTRADRLALLEAAAEGGQARVEALFAKGVNLDGTLGNAARSGNAELVRWLISHGVDPKEDEDLSAPPILLGDAHDGVVKVLLERGAHEPTLAKAVALGAPRAVSRLLGKGASASSKTTDGEPVLMVAVRDSTGPSRRVIVGALVSAGANVDVKFEGETPLSLALASAVSSNTDEAEKAGDRAIDLVASLVGRGAKVDGEMLITALEADAARRASLLDVVLAGSLNRNATALAVSHAAERHDVVSIKKLATKGISWSAGDMSQPPPLATAIVASDVATVRALLDAGAPTDRMGEDGDTALLAAVAAAAGDSDDALRVLRVLFEYGASANKRGRDGRTALFAAAQQGSEGLVALLVARGARVDDVVDGMTAIEVADGRGHEGVVRLLKARGARLKRVAVD